MPYSNVPEELWDKMDRCVKDVMSKQDVAKDRAIAICHSAIVKADTIGVDMLLTKAQRLSDGRVRWQARANTGQTDSVGDRFDETFWDDVVQNFMRVSEAVSRGQTPPHPIPILDVSHYSYFLPADKRNLARIGWPTKVWKDGHALMAQGFFDNTPQGVLAAKAALKNKPENRRVSICVYPDYSRVDVDVEAGGRVFRGGQGVAYLDHLALTAHPLDPGAHLEVITKMNDTTMGEDVLETLGSDAQEIVDILEKARVRKSETDPGLVVKADGDTAETDEVETEVATEDVVEAPAALSEDGMREIALAALKSAAPGIGKAIDNRLDPLVKAVADLQAQIVALKSSEDAKLKAALDGDGDWFGLLWKNSVQHDPSVVVKGQADGVEQTPETDYGKRYG